MTIKHDLEFDNNLVNKVSDFLQNYMKTNSIKSMTADECADLLDKNRILLSAGHPKPGFNFRQLLRDGRYEKVNLIKGAYQESPRKRWQINNIG